MTLTELKSHFDMSQSRSVVQLEPWAGTNIEGATKVADDLAKLLHLPTLIGFNGINLLFEPVDQDGEESLDEQRDRYYKLLAARSPRALTMPRDLAEKFYDLIAFTERLMASLYSHGLASRPGLTTPGPQDVIDAARDALNQFKTR